VIANEICNERRRLSLAGVGGNDVNALGRFVETLANLVGCLGFAFDLRANAPSTT
jgi:hypothetical protein